MNNASIPDRRQRRRGYVLAALVLANMLCAVFFIIDVAADYESLAADSALHLRMEAAAALVLILGTAFLVHELRRLLQRSAAMETGLQIARGEMGSVIERFFAEWHLTTAERDVAMLLIKGYDNEAIARLRGRAAGTVRAQCARIYAKAGVDGRSQLLSIFMEELLGERLLPAASRPRADDAPSASASAD